jgi:hypothetical protein
VGTVDIGVGGTTIGVAGAVAATGSGAGGAVGASIGVGARVAAGWGGVGSARASIGGNTGPAGNVVAGWFIGTAGLYRGGWAAATFVGCGCCCGKYCPCGGTTTIRGLPKADLDASAFAAV